MYSQKDKYRKNIKVKNPRDLSPKWFNKAYGRTIDSKTEKM